METPPSSVSLFFIFFLKLNLEFFLPPFCPFYPLVEMEGNLDVFRCGKGYIKMSLVKVVDLVGVELITENHCLLSRAVRGSDI